MKILMIAQYVYDKNLIGLQKNETGFGYMVKDIAVSVAEEEEVFLLTRAITEKTIYKKVNLVNHSWLDVFKKLSIKNLKNGIRAMIKYPQKLSMRLRYFYYNIDMGYVKSIIEKIQPDIIHLHGASYSGELYTQLCEEMKIPYVVTLHGLNGLDDSIKRTISTKEALCEKDIFSKDIPVTCISSGVKNRAIKFYTIKNIQKIRVVTNGTSVEYVNKKNTISIREQYHIQKDDKIIMSIGNISENKNQIQLVKAYNNLPLKIRSKSVILFLGNDTNDQLLQNEISKVKRNDRLIYCGFIERDEIWQYWKEADLNVVASLNEGFGLSMIEGFVYGVPTMTYSDLDAVEDLYHEKVMVLSKKRNDEVFVNALEEALTRYWDREWIKEYSKNFSLEKMAENYCIVYKDILNNE